MEDGKRNSVWNIRLESGKLATTTTTTTTIVLLKMLLGTWSHRLVSARVAAQRPQPLGAGEASHAGIMGWFSFKSMLQLICTGWGGAAPAL